MTIANFTDLIASYSNRVAALFTTVGAQDVILAAMNDARRDAQRRYRFNMNTRQVFAQLSLKPASLLSDFKVDPIGGAAVVVSRLDSLWEYGTQTVASTACYYPTRELDIRRSSELSTSINSKPWPFQSSSVTATADFAYMMGTDIRHSNLTTQTWFMGQAVVFLPDLISSDSPDIFLTYFTDWLKFATLLNLNVWLKDAERFNIDTAVMTTLWNSVTQFDAQQANPTNISLD